MNHFKKLFILMKAECFKFKAKCEFRKKQKGEIDQSRFLDSICQPTNFNQWNERKGDSL